MTEFTDDAKQTLRRARAWEEITSLPSWKTVLEQLQERLDIEASTALAPAKGMDDLVVREFNKGAFFAIQFVMSLPRVTMQTAADIRASNPGIGKSDATVDGPDADSVPSNPVGNAP